MEDEFPVRLNMLHALASVRITLLASSRARPQSLQHEYPGRSTASRKVLYHSTHFVTSLMEAVDSSWTVGDEALISGTRTHHPDMLTASQTRFFENLGGNSCLQFSVFPNARLVLSSPLVQPFQRQACVSYDSNPFRGKRPSPMIQTLER